MGAKNECLIILVVMIASIVPLRAVTPQRLDALNKAVEKIFHDKEMTALGIAVTHGDSIIYRQSIGYRVRPMDNFPGEPLADDDLFRIASVSKTFIATAILRLQEENKLNINDDAQRYLNYPLRNPKYPKVPITIKDLLTHTSSLNDSRSYWNLDILNPETDREYFKCYSPTRPGRDYKYCNLNYVLLAAVIEGATGRRFDSEIDRIIMRPLNIHGNFNTNLLDSTKFVRLYYRDEKDGTTLIDNVENYFPYKHQIMDNYKLGKSLGLEYPAAGMKITVDDLAKYMMMHCHNGTQGDSTVISPASEALMRKNYVGKNNYGLSYRQYRQLLSGKLLHGQTGGNPGAKTCMIFDPISDIGFVILTSGAKTDYIDGYGDIHAPLIRMLYAHLFE